MIRRHIRFYGKVQGVGFRYRARHAADMYSCTGWAKNEYDGSVTMEIQGEPDAIEKVISIIAQGRFVNIEAMDAKTVPAIEGERAFGSF